MKTRHRAEQIVVSLRHTAGTLLAASGVHPKVAQSVRRRSGINLTMSRYSHVRVRGSTVRHAARACSLSPKC